VAHVRCRKKGKRGQPSVWEIRGYLDKDHEKTKTFVGMYDAARTEATAFQKELDERRVPVAAPGTVGELLEEYHKRHAWKSTGAKNHAREDLDTYLVPHLGAYRLAGFDEKPIEKLYDGLQATGDDCLAARGNPLADGSVRRLHTTGRAAFNWAIKRKKAAWNPFLVVEPPAEDTGEIAVPDPEEVHAICAAATGEFGVFVRATVATGRRRQDILALRLNDLKPHEPALVFDERIVLQKNGDILTPNQRMILAILCEGPVVSSSGQAAVELGKQTGHQTVVGVTKALRILERHDRVARTIQGRRTYRIEITPAGLDALAAEPANASAIVIERSDKAKRTARVRIDPDTMDLLQAQVESLEARARLAGTQLVRGKAFIFSDDLDGKEPWRPDSTSRKFAQLMGKLRMDYTLHSLRHFHITELLTGGVFGDPMDVETVAARVGDDPRTIYKVYSHLRKTSDERAANHMAKFFAETPRPNLRAV
jgi:integrase